MEAQGHTSSESASTRKEFALERYRYILQQIQVVNENAHRFLAIYQTLATSLVGAGITLFVGYRRWGISASVARDGVIGLLVLVTLVAGFTITLIAVGALAWLDYRNEECDITDEIVGPGFRQRPRLRNISRWYETYVLLFILISIVTLWTLAAVFVLPKIK
ncbi:hypothetical protein [Streptomyces sp. NBC_01235]|uniref:hypothetical protein n=1 Tax=Streptomyces sp. NBC_01235 TaxID=2903788 RepID=UPI002E0DD9AE|nr:hypothetical protein OG289_35685 [Streptomyces sp. NBC_01235]